MQGVKNIRRCEFEPPPPPAFPASVKQTADALFVVCMAFFLWFEWAFHPIPTCCEWAHPKPTIETALLTVARPKQHNTHASILSNCSLPTKKNTFPGNFLLSSEPPSVPHGVAALPRSNRHPLQTAAASTHRLLHLREEQMCWKEFQESGLVSVCIHILWVKTPPYVPEVDLFGG